jgi:hypothetical protein
MYDRLPRGATVTAYHTLCTWAAGSARKLLPKLGSHWRLSWLFSIVGSSWSFPRLGS